MFSFSPDLRRLGQFKIVNIIMSFGEDFYNGAGFCVMR